MIDYRIPGLLSVPRVRDRWFRLDARQAGEASTDAWPWASVTDVDHVAVSYLDTSEFREDLNVASDCGQPWGQAGIFV